MKKGRGGLVYSTAVGPGKGRLCAGCQRPVAECVCKDVSRIQGDGTAIISRETKGRKGAGVTLIRGLPLTGTDLTRLAKKLKAKCGVGGSVKNEVIELQGDQRDRSQALLEAEGFKTRRSGG
jgi:translation initiation factor 1